MKKIKKLLSVILVTAIVFTTFSIGITASAENAMTENSATADSPLEVIVTTNKTDYGKFDIAEFTVTVTNTSDETVENISAEAIFNDLDPVGKKSETSKEVGSLNAGESFSFSYKATLSLDNSDVDFFSKIILWLVRIFNGGYTANENNFDNGRGNISKVDVINFGKVSADNEVMVWYEYNIYKDMYNNQTIDNEVKELENGLKYVENELLIGTVEGTTEQEVEEIIKPYNGVIVGYIAFSGDYQIKFPNIKNIEELERIKNNIKNNHIITYVILNYVDELTPQVTSYNPYENYIPSDPYNGDNWNAFTPWGSNWGVEAVGALQAWTKRSELRTINIGVIDSMFDVNHQDLSFAEVWNNPDNVSELYLSDKTNDSFYHGTHVAGIFASKFDNGIGISGVYPNNNANLYAYATHGQSSYSGLMDWKVALGKMILNNVKVINISLGYENYCEQASKGNQDVIKELDLASEILSDYLKNFLNSGFDFVICHSAGNGNDYPHCDILAQYSSFLTNIKDKEIKDRIIVVGSAYMSIIPMYSIASYSNVGDRVDVMAPGENIYSAMPNNEYAYKGGTSMASPIVAGTAAMIWGANSTLNGTDVKWIIENSTTETVSGTEKKLVDAGVSINVALNVTGNGEANNQNKGQFIVDVKNAQTNEFIPNTWISVTSTDNSILYCHEQTDVLGEFSTLLPKGKYNVSIYHSDYVEVNDFIVEISNKEITTKSVLLSRKTSIITSTLSGTVKDETTGNAISGVRVEFVDNSTDSLDPVATATTDENGLFSAKLPYGSYSMSFNHDDYEYYGESIEVDFENIELSEPILLTPKNSSGGGSEENIFQGGNGTEENPYQVSTPEQLNAVRNNLSAHYIQTADIDMSNWGNWEPIGTDETPFTGIYDGNTYTISNNIISAIVTESGEDIYLGLFGYAQQATIKNLTTSLSKITMISSTNYQYIDFCISNIVACAEECQILNCTSSSSNLDVSVKSGKSNGFIGGIVGKALGSVSISECISKGYYYIDCNASGWISDFKANVYVGGIVGGEYLHGNNFSRIINCTSECEFISANYANTTIVLAGIAGTFWNSYDNNKAEISGCVNYSIFKNNKPSDSGELFLCGISSMSNKISDSLNYGDFNIQGIGTIKIAGIGDALQVNNCCNYGNIYVNTAYDSVSAKSIIGGISCSSSQNISNCTNYGVISANIRPSGSGNGDVISGVVGEMTGGGVVENCKNMADITLLLNDRRMYIGYANNETTLGGIVGYLSNSKVTLCMNQGNLTAIGFDESQCCTSSVGGIVGVVNNGTGNFVDRCYNIGNLCSNTYSGGIVGKSYSCNISNCYNSASIQTKSHRGNSWSDEMVTTYASGILGYADGYDIDATKINYCYNVGNILQCNQGDSQCGGICSVPTHVTFNSVFALNIPNNNLRDIEYVTMLRSDQMSNKDSFIGFNFNDIWEIKRGVNNNYPYLKNIL